MPSRPAKRKQRFQSEPLPSRSDEDEDDVAQDELKIGAALAGSKLDADVKMDLNSPPPTADKGVPSRFAQDPQLRAIGKKIRAMTDSTRTTTTTSGSASTVAFPLTPTSAAGEGDRTMASLTAAGSSAEKARASEDKMTTHSSINDPSTRPPPPDVPANNPSSLNNTNSLRAPQSRSNGSAAVPSPAAYPPHPLTMTHRVEHNAIRPRHFQQDQHFHDPHYYSAHPSPPPITTLTHSPSLSSDRSSVNSPAPTILPPLAHHASQFQQPYIASGGHRYPSSAQPGAYHHSHYYPNTVSPPEVFAAPAQTYTPSYGSGYPPPPAHVPFHHTTEMSMSPSHTYSVNPYATTGSLYGHGGHGGGGSGGYTPIYTDDASTKLSDRVRRRCFNCCTTDTSTWRRSSLNPGKVLCNKCGLFERTHSRPRPDQFPHKRAPLQIPNQNMPPHDASTSAQQHQAQSHASQGAHGPNAAAAAAVGGPHNLPPTPGHPSLGTAYPSALPQIQEWLRPNSGAGPGGAANANHTGPVSGTAGSPSTSSSGSAGPSSRAHSASSAADHRHHPYANSVPASTSASGMGAGANEADTRSPQTRSVRLTKRSNSVNSDSGTTPESQLQQQRRTAQNLTPSSSPPPEVAQSAGTVTTEDSTLREQDSGKA